VKYLRCAAAALALLFAGVAQAQQAGPPAWLQQLDLSEAQQEQVFQIFYQLTPVVRERILAARRAHEELEDLAIAVSLDSDRGRELFAAEAQALADVADLRLHAMRSVYELLTAEQRAQALHLPIRYE
jgi:Spy/CpxP family protein refolding chaperone